MVRKIIVMVMLVALAVIALMAAGTYYVAREAKDVVVAEADRQREAKCVAMRAELDEKWNRAVDRRATDDVEDQLATIQRAIDANCRKK